MYSLTVAVTNNIMDAAKKALPPWAISGFTNVSQITAICVGKSSPHHINMEWALQYDRLVSRQHSKDSVLVNVAVNFR